MNANYETPLNRYELSAWVTVAANDEDEALKIAQEIMASHPKAEVTLSIDDGVPIDVTEEWEP